MFSQVVSLIQVFKHWGRTLGHGADGEGEALDAGIGELPLVTASTELSGTDGRLVCGITETVDVIVPVMVETVVLVW